MRNMQEIEILHVDEKTKQATAFSFNPDFISSDATRDILSKQIEAANPIEIHCYIRNDDSWGGVYKTIEADDFVKARALNDSEKQTFIENAAGLIKSDRTFDVIFSKAYEQPERVYRLDPSKLNLEELHRISGAQIKTGRRVDLYKEEKGDVTKRTFDCKGAQDLPQDEKKQAVVTFIRAMRKSNLVVISNRKE